MTRTFGPVDARSLQQLETCLAVDPTGTARGVLCADHHPGYAQPIGGVVAYEHHISPNGVGFDIACGNLAARTNISTTGLADGEIARVMDEISAVISFGIGRTNAEPVDHPVLEEIAHAPIASQQAMTTLAAQQLGTVGSGNHYVDLFRDAESMIWIGVHFGSRGFGHRTCRAFLEEAGCTSDGMDSRPVLIDTRTPLGQDYLQAMALAGRYAHAGREWVVTRVAAILGATLTDAVHNHHNFAWRERHHGRDWWVIRKGATPAFPGQRGFVGGSMGEISVILEGVETETARQALYSTVHGAGRVMSRTEAAGKVKQRKVWRCGDRECNATTPVAALPAFRQGRDPNPRCPSCGATMHRARLGERIRDGKVNWPLAKQAVQDAGIVLRGGGADEAPEVYKRLPEVLAAHGDTVRVVHTLSPIGVAMAGAKELDPYRD